MSLFLDFRARFINDQTAADIAEITQLMLNNQLKLDPDTYSPATGRVLNHLEWVGYFDKRRLVSQEHIWSTFGSTVINLYPGLFEYMCKRREERNLPDLWRNVDLLYKRLWRYASRNHKLGDHDSPSTLKMRKFLPKHQRKAGDIEFHLKLQRKNRSKVRTGLFHPACSTSLLVRSKKI